MVAAALFLVVLLHSLVFSELRHDDAFITYRYGQNLIHHGEFVFNLGDRTMASSSPGQALLAACLIPLLGDSSLATTMVVLGVLGWVMQGFLLFLLLRQALGSRGALFIGLAVLAGLARSQVWLALETNLVVALVLGAFLAANHQRWSLGAAAAGLAILFRPDAALPMALFAGSCLGARGRGAWKPLLIGSGLLLPWLLFATLYFGTPVPRSATAKFQQANVLEYARHIAIHPAEVLLGRVDGVFSVLIWVLIVCGAILLIRRHRDSWWLPAYAFLHAGAYLWLRPPTAHAWHLYPFALASGVLALVPLAALTTVSRRAASRAGTWGLAIVLLLVSARTAAFARAYRHDYWIGDRHRVYVETASYLRAHSEPVDRVAALEVGTVAYVSELPVYDVAGLTTRVAEMLPSDVRWALVVSHQVAGWWDADWQPPEEVPFHSLRPVRRFVSGRFAVWVFEIPRVPGQAG